jgi:transposase
MRWSLLCRGSRVRVHARQKLDALLASKSHEDLILNWFRAKGEISYGFRTYEGMEIALDHNLGRLPEPESTHRFC